MIKLERDETAGLDDPSIVSFHDLPKQRQVKALQSYSESFRRVIATGAQRGGRSSRQMRRAMASIARRK